jgi:phosphoserine aminotransferase
MILAIRFPLKFSNPKDCIKMHATLSSEDKMFENFKVPEALIPSDPRFGCGPSLIPMDHVEALLGTGQHLLGTSHRKAPIKNLVKDVQDGLKEYFQLPEEYSVVIGNGGATFLFDGIALGIVEKKAAHFTCGEFSNKWFKSSKLVPWIEAQEFAVDMGAGVRGQNVDDADVICVTLNETSTGVQLDSIPDVDENTILAIDSTSGAGQVPCDVSKVDLFFFSPQKVFASEGGTYIAIMSPKARARALKIAGDKSRYVPGIMDWKTAIDNSDKNQTYNTPSVSSLFFLNEQIKLMNKEGYEAIVKESQRKADLLYGWAEEKGYLSPFISEKEFRSLAVATIDIDEKVDVSALLTKLHNEQIVYGIDSYRKLGRNQFRIALFHNVTYENLEKLTKLLSAAIESEL